MVVRKQREGGINGTLIDLQEEKNKHAIKKVPRFFYLHLLSTSTLLQGGLKSPWAQMDASFKDTLEMKSDGYFSSSFPSAAFSEVVWGIGDGTIMTFPAEPQTISSPWVTCHLITSEPPGRAFVWERLPSQHSWVQMCWSAEAAFSAAHQKLVCIQCQGIFGQCGMD